MMNNIVLTKKNNYAIVQLNKGKVNAINHELVREIRALFRDLEDDKEVRGVIITGQPRYFSAGLDLIELINYDLGQIMDFWSDFMGMMIDLAKFSKPTIAAISGYSPAGGAVIAVTCDYRYMAEGEDFHIGLNEVALGIPIAENIFALYGFWLGDKAAYQALLEGKLFSVQEAFDVGLVDKVVPLEGLVEAAEDKMSQLLRSNDAVLRGAKRMMRFDLMKKVDVGMDDAINERSQYWMSAPSQASLKAIVDRLTEGKG